MSETPKPRYWELFHHMEETYHLTLIEDELQQIVNKADECRMKAEGRSDMVRWALINALFHLDTEQLHELGEAIARRSGGSYTRSSMLAVIPETHQNGFLSIENLDAVLKHNLQDCAVGLQTAADGRVWLCVNGMGLIRFKPHRRAETKQKNPVDTQPTSG